MALECRSIFCVVLATCLMGNVFSAPSMVLRTRREQNRLHRDALDKTNDLDASSSQSSPDTDDDDDDFGSMQTTSGGGSNLFSLLNLVTALFPSSSSSNKLIRNTIRQYLLRQQKQVNIRRKDIEDNVIEIGYVKNLTLPHSIPSTFQRQEDDESNSHDVHDDDDSESASNHDDDDSNSASGHDENHSSSASDENNAAEESVENNKDETDKTSQQNSNGDAKSEEDNGSDYDEPEGDGQGGGVLGILAGLSGGEDGSDLGTLLATVSQIVGNLSGDGFDLNALITSAFGLFVGLLSQGEENPGEVISSYLLTSLDTITGGGAQNNGAFIGRFISNLLKGVSAAEGESGESSEEGKMKMADSAGFFISLLTSLSGDMSKGSSGSSHPW